MANDSDRKSGFRLFYWSSNEKGSKEISPTVPAACALLPAETEPANRKGKLAEIAFLNKASALGFGVAKPYGDSERYDFILDSGERLWRVQVKSVGYLCLGGGQGYRTASCHSRGRYKDLPYTADHIDFLVAYIVPRDVG